MLENVIFHTQQIFIFLFMTSVYLHTRKRIHAEVKLAPSRCYRIISTAARVSIFWSRFAETLRSSLSMRLRSYQTWPFGCKLSNILGKASGYGKSNIFLPQRHYKVKLIKGLRLRFNLFWFHKDGTWGRAWERPCGDHKQRKQDALEKRFPSASALN